MIITIFLTDPYIIVIDMIVIQLFCSWSEGEERDRETGLGRGKQNTKIIRREELWPKNTQLSNTSTHGLRGCDDDDFGCRCGGLVLKFE